MKSNLLYKRSFLIIAYGVFIQLLIYPYYEIPMLKGDWLKPYIIAKLVIAGLFILFIYLLHNLKLVKYWLILFHLCCFSFTLVGQFFNPGYHFAVIQYMFVCAIVFEGFSHMSALMTILYITQYYLHPFANEMYPFYHTVIYKGIISSWITSVAMEHYISRVKNKQSFLDRKLRYKGIKTDLFMHDLKNKFQSLMAFPIGTNEIADMVAMMQSFNSYHDDSDVTFEEVVLSTREKFEIGGTCTVVGTEDFFIDQMDLQTILCNLMKNSERVARSKDISLHISIKNKSSGFIYEDNAGGMSDEQLKFFNQKEIKPHPGHEKSGLGLFLVKKLVEHHEGKFSIKKIANGTRFEIAY